jgi:hypothetical protein
MESAESAESADQQLVTPGKENTPTDENEPSTHYDHNPEASISDDVALDAAEAPGVEDEKEQTDPPQSHELTISQLHFSFVTHRVKPLSIPFFYIENSFDGEYIAGGRTD